jgi:hypothetical protein
MLYLYSRTQDSERLQKFKAAGYDTRLWKSYNFLDAPPLIFRVFKVLATMAHKENRNYIYVYKVRLSDLGKQQ